MTGTRPRPGDVPTTSAYRRARHRLRTYVSEHPSGYLAFARHKYPNHNVEVIGPRTELVIDGFTRSATTFAVYAFQLSQDRPVRLAHHLHAPAQLIVAARRGIPALALIREPQGAILSQLIQEPHVVLRDALVAYSRFYEHLRPSRGSLVVGEFKQVTHDFAAVMRQVNARFGTHFAEFVPSEANLREVTELCQLREIMPRPVLGFESGLISRDELRVELRATGAVPAHGQDAWIPSADRDRAKATLRDQWMQPSLARLRSRAEQAYQAFVAG